MIYRDMLVHGTIYVATLADNKVKIGHTQHSVVIGNTGVMLPLPTSWMT